MTTKQLRNSITRTVRRLAIRIALNPSERLIALYNHYLDVLEQLWLPTIEDRHAA